MLILRVTEDFGSGANGCHCCTPLLHRLRDRRKMGRTLLIQNVEGDENGELSRKNIKDGG